MIYKTPHIMNEENKTQVTEEIVNCINNLDEKDEMIIDLEDTLYVSSAGLIPLMIGYKVSLKKGNEFTTINPQTEVAEVFRLTGLDKTFLKNDNNKSKKA